VGWVVVGGGGWETQKRKRKSLPKTDPVGSPPQAPTKKTPPGKKRNKLRK